MTSLYPLGSVYIALNAALEEGNLSEQEVQDVVNRQIENELVAQERAVQIAKDIRSIQGYQDMIRSEIDDLKMKLARAERMEQSIMRGVENYMRLKNQDTLEAGTSKFAYRKSTTCEIIDESKVPAQFKTVETTVKINKQDLKNAAKNGDAIEFVDGFQIAEHRNLHLK